MSEQARLLIGAATVTAAPIILFLALRTGRGFSHGLRIRRVKPEGFLTVLSVQVDRLLRANSLSERIDRRLDVAATKMRAGEFVTLVLGATLLVATVLSIMGLRVSAAIAFVAVPALAWFTIRRRAKSRIADFAAKFADTLRVIAGSLRAGNSTMQAIAAAAENATSPIAEELTRVVSEGRIGRDPVSSLQDMAVRMESEDAKWVVEAIALNRELGGNLASTLDSVADTMRARAEIASQVQVMSSEGRLTARVLLSLPIIIGVILQFLNPEYLDQMFYTGPGNIMLAVIVGLMLVGAFWVSRLVKLEY